MRKSFVYKSPWIYEHGLKLLHGKHFSERYEYIGKLLKGVKTVLEPGCGPSILPDYIDKRISYKGFDLNKEFVKIARKKGRDVWTGNVLDSKNYSPSDAIVVCDVYHHLRGLDRKLLIKNCYVNSKKMFIMCEPIFIMNEPLSNNRLLGNLIKKVSAYFDADGINNIDANNYFTYEDLSLEIENGFGIIPKNTRRKIRKIGQDLVVLFIKNQKSF